jgi:hypothetical protein
MVRGRRDARVLSRPYIQMAYQPQGECHAECIIGNACQAVAPQLHADHLHPGRRAGAGSGRHPRGGGRRNLVRHLGRRPGRTGARRQLSQLQQPDPAPDRPRQHRRQPRARTPVQRARTCFGADRRRVAGRERLRRQPGHGQQPPAALRRQRRHQPRRRQRAAVGPGGPEHPGPGQPGAQPVPAGQRAGRHRARRRLPDQLRVRRRQLRRQPEHQQPAHPVLLAFPDRDR